MGVTHATLSLAKDSYLLGETVTATIVNRDPARFYTWGWTLRVPDGTSMGEDGIPSPSGETEISQLLQTWWAEILERYGTAAITFTLEEWTSDPVWPDDFTDPRVTPPWVGRYTVSATVYSSTTTLPEITAVTLTEGNPAVTSANIGGFVQGVSSLAWDVDATGSDGRAITAYEVTIDDVVYRSEVGASAALKNSGSVTVNTKVTDGVGRTQTRTDTITVLPYTPPSINAYDAFRSDASGVELYTGEYLHTDFTGTATSLVVGTEKNATTYLVRTRPVGTEAWTTIDSGTSGLTATSSVTVAGYDVDTSYEVRLDLSDKLTSVAAVTFVAKGGFVLDLGKDNVGVGKEWERGVLDVGGDTYISGALDVTGDSVATGNVSAGGEVLHRGDIVLEPVGILTMFAGSAAPTGWLICDGTAVSRTTYASLFSVVGTSFGPGDGSTTFNLPNMGGRMPMGVTPAYIDYNTVGKIGGAPGHNHGVDGTAFAKLSWEAGGKVRMDRQSSPVSWDSDVVTTNSPGALVADTTNTSNSIGVVGSTGDASHIPPYLVVNYIIKAL